VPDLRRAGLLVSVLARGDPPAGAAIGATADERGGHAEDVYATEGTPMTADQERALFDLSAAIQCDIEAVLEAHQQRRIAAGEPRFTRWLALHAVVELAGRMMLSTLFEQGDEARPALARMIQQLEMLVLPAGRRAN
jgi:hypothetical protein